MADIPKRAGTAIGIILMVVIAGVFLASLTPVFNLFVGETNFEPSTSEYTDIGAGDDRPGGLEVKATTGNAVYFDGNGHVDTEAPDLHASWTVCTVARLDDENANTDSHYDLVAVENETITLRYEGGNWTARHINATVETSATANATAPTELTTICGRWNESAGDLTLFVDGELVNESSAGESTTRSVAVDFVGTLDETRMWDTDISDEEMQAFGDEPIAASATEPDARWMFDEGEGSTSIVYYLGTDADLVGVSWTTGVPDPGLEEGTDWEAQTDPFSIRAISDGILDGAPVIHVSWQGGFGGILSTVLSMGQTVLIVVALLSLAVGARFIREEFE